MTLVDLLVSLLLRFSEETIFGSWINCSSCVSVRTVLIRICNVTQTVREVPWFTERIITDVTLGSLIIIVLYRMAQYNLTNLQVSQLVANHGLIVWLLLLKAASYDVHDDVHPTFASTSVKYSTLDCIVCSCCIVIA